MTKVLITGLNHNQLDYIKEIKKKGYYIIGVDKNPNPPAKSFCNKFYNFGYDEIEKILNVCIKEKFNENDKIFTASLQESYLYLSYVAENLGIKFPSRKNVEIVLDKLKLYPFFKKNKVKYPDTQYIFEPDELFVAYKKIKDGECYYLKSDYSKNPNYVYRIIKGKFDISSVNWVKDRYLRKGYVFQKEFKGEEIRINIFGKSFLAYPFNVDKVEKIGPLDEEFANKLCELGIIKTLKDITHKLGLEKYLVKFDIILNDEQNFVVLDIGIDPPYRMRHHYESIGLNFVKMYIEQYLDGNIYYPFTSKVC